MNAREQIRKKLDELFLFAPQSKAAWELQEELFANCMEKYGDLCAGGMGEEAAINTVIAGIGNVDDLIASLPKENAFEAIVQDEERQRRALLKAVSIGLYIAAGAVFFLGIFIGDVLWEGAVTLGLVLAALICIIPTCMLVYDANKNPTYPKKDNTVVEEFKEWNSDSKKLKSVRNAVSSLLWTLTVLLYLGISFATFQWHITWIIFLISACIEAAINLFFKLVEMRK